MNHDSQRPPPLLLHQMVDPVALPLYISPEVAETILFVGKAVWMLKHPSGSFEGQELLPIRCRLRMGVG